MLSNCCLLLRKRGASAFKCITLLYVCFPCYQPLHWQQLYVNINFTWLQMHQQMQLYKLQKQNLLVNLSYAFYILLRVMPLWIITYGWFTLMVKLTYVVADADADATVQQLKHYPKSN